MVLSSILLAILAWRVHRVSGINPTHYGDPNGGCEVDEKVVQVQGVVGDFCSPACTDSECPSDEPSGATAKPQCALHTPTGAKYCALICTPSILSKNGANGECGAGTCHSIQGVGLCTYTIHSLSDAVVKTNLKQETETVSTNPTHYGDPKGGCEADEQAIQVQGVAGDFCSPKCKKSVCPADEPSGATASPQCALRTPSGDKYCALICTPSVASKHGAKGECGKGTCQSIQGVGLCTYAMGSSTDIVIAATLLPVLDKMFTNPSHYGDPRGGCEADEEAIRVEGVSGDFCSPKCVNSKCPTDEPSGVTAKPQCALQTATKEKYCALICSPSVLSKNGARGECGAGTCQSIRGVGLCTYAITSASIAEIEATFEANTENVLVNPTHYGDPKGGCEADEEVARVQGVAGDFCSPKCTESACPTDEPSGATATPQCALRTPSGDKYCALICTPSPTNKHGAKGECGKGTCQSIQGVGLCTYATGFSSDLIIAATLQPVLDKVFMNPSHYGDPKGGCEDDEEATRVEGVPGEFCSPKCIHSKCPMDEPSGATAKPQCALQSTSGEKYCALICSPSPLRKNGAHGECGAGTCQSIQGVGLCTYATTPVSNVVVTSTFTTEIEDVRTNPTHYGDPKGGCEGDELVAQVRGVVGDFCSPQCTNSACPTDEPRGVTAKPQCALQTATGDKYCALVCTPSVVSTNGARGECGRGTCQSISGIGVCTYATGSSTDLVMATTALQLVFDKMLTNPSHYGDPRGGCEADEEAIKVEGVAGDFCSPKCRQSKCPTDEPSGATAKPQCALQTTSGEKYCALICNPSVLSKNGARGECGAGTCQSIQGVGLCTYSSSTSIGLLSRFTAQSESIVV